MKAAVAICGLYSSLLRDVCLFESIDGCVIRAENQSTVSRELMTIVFKVPYCVKKMKSLMFNLVFLFMVCLILHAGADWSEGDDEPGRPVFMQNVNILHKDIAPNSYMPN
ncbi:hypothetical protein LSTR_LSTR009116 [Laodelphax striatellus]|uniref:Uncharacterized protein n=1 Tax=Laodelphax striatellus TaxID=195883 RepID=A0A482XNN9_LAOST|nr:hypothetical protein LSTR_LSTR009116 [Laodelphax striatellus]